MVQKDDLGAIVKGDQNLYCWGQVDEAKCR